MRVIDSDSHYFEPADWLSQIDPALAAEIPPHDPIERVVRFVVGDLLDAVPRNSTSSPPSTRSRRDPTAQTSGWAQATTHPRSSRRSTCAGRRA